MQLQPRSLIQHHQQSSTCVSHHLFSPQTPPLTASAPLPPCARLSRRQKQAAGLITNSTPSDKLADAPEKLAEAPEKLADHIAEQSGEIPENKQGHAVLHDFCMGIPYGAIVLAAGVVSLIFGSGSRGVSFAAAGSGVLASAFLSLVQWRSDRPSRLPTVATAGITTAVAWGFWNLVQAGTASVPNTVMFGLSLAMLAFLLYNIFAGGNPPQKSVIEENKASSAAPASA